MQIPFFVKNWQNIFVEYSQTIQMSYLKQINT